MSKRHKKKREPQGTGAPDPSKDRTKHEAARGKKKVTLQDLTRQLPSEDDLDHYLTLIADESDRGAALMAAALVERSLEDRVRSQLHDPGDGTAKTWFEGANAPFRSFSAKITLGLALKVYDDYLGSRLTVIRNVRNVFAHSMIPLQFAHPAIKAECAKLPPPEQDHSHLDPKGAFAVSCLVLARILGMKAIHRTVFAKAEAARGQSAAE